MKLGTESKLKFKTLKRKLALAHWQCIGLLEALWLATYQNAPAGDIGRLSDSEIAAAIEWEGPADELVAALVECRWLDLDDEFRLIVHDWSEHVANHLAGAFKKHGKTFADIAARDRAKQPAREPARQGARQPAISTLPPILANSSQAKPSKSNGSCSETRSASSEPDEPILLEFECDGTRPVWFLTQSLLDKLHEAYPSIDLLAEARKALAWVEANPRRRKTHTGMRQFLNNWFAKAQNESGRQRPAQQSFPSKNYTPTFLDETA